MTLKTLFALSALALPTLAMAESEMPSYGDAIADSPSLEQELAEFESPDELPAEDYEALSSAMEMLTSENTLLEEVIPENESLSLEEQ